MKKLKNNLLDMLELKMANEFSENSKKHNISIPKAERAEHGIYFTPNIIRDRLFEKLIEFNIDSPTSILEPSFGSGEFIKDVIARYPTASIYGVEKHKALFDSVSEVYTGPNIHLSNCDFMDWVGAAVDLIIGNPPYLMVKTDKMTKTDKKAFIEKHEVSSICRFNAYVLFLYKCLTEHLKPLGVLAFILPTSFYNSSYYEPMRKYIYAHTTIIYVENLDNANFYQTGQDTMLIIIRRNKPASAPIEELLSALSVDDTTTTAHPPPPYIFKMNENIYISPFYKELYQITKDRKTLKELGLSVKTGSVVWNQFKENLSDDPIGSTLLIYSSNITNSILTLNNLKGIEKKQYVKGLEKQPLSGHHILVERGYGNSFKFNAVLVNKSSFYAENHLNVIYSKTALSPIALQKVLTDVIASFNDEETILFVKRFIGNGSLSATELENIIPIKIQGI